MGGLLTQIGLVSIPNWFGKMVDFSGFGTPERRVENAPFFIDSLMSFFCINEKSSLSRPRLTLGQAAWNVGRSSVGWRWFFCLILTLLSFVRLLKLVFLFGFGAIFYGEKMRHYGLGYGVGFAIFWRDMGCYWLHPRWGAE